MIETALSISTQTTIKYENTKITSTPRTCIAKTSAPKRVSSNISSRNSITKPGSGI